MIASNKCGVNGIKLAHPREEICHHKMIKRLDGSSSRKSKMANKSPVSTLIIGDKHMPVGRHSASVSSINIYELFPFSCEQ